MNGLRDTSQVRDIPVVASPDEASAGRFVDLVEVIRRHVFLILLIASAGAGLGYLSYVKTPPTFESTCGLLVTNQSKESAMPFQGAENAQVKDTFPHAMLINSTVVIKNALTKYELNKLPLFAGDDSAVSKIKSDLRVKFELDSPEILGLSFTSQDRAACEVVLDAVIKSYRDFLDDNHESINTQVVDLIGQASQELETQLTKEETEYEKFRSSTPLLFAGGTTAMNLHKERLSKIEDERSQLMIAQNSRQSELQALTKAIQNGGNREALELVIQSQRAMRAGGDSLRGGMKSVASELFPMLTEEQMLLQKLGSDHPKLQELRQKIVMTRQFLTEDLTTEQREAVDRKRGDFVSIYLDSLEHEIMLLKQRMEELNSFFQEESAKSMELTQFELEDISWRDKIARTKQLFDGVVKRLDEINLVKGHGGYKTAIISPPTDAYQVAPSLIKSLLIGFILGSFVGFGLGYLIELCDQTFRSPADISEQLGLPIVGHVPVIPVSKRRFRSSTKIDTTLVTFHRPNSRLSEAYRAVRTALYFSTRGEQHKVIQVCSPNPADGKTTLACNLAVSIAQSGKKVLLIDADFRRPRIHKVFGLQAKTGMSSVIAGVTELPDAIQSTEVENLSVLPCGPRPSNPSELLTSRRFEELLAVIREQFDFVIVDTPPVLAVTDPGAVAARVDGVIMTMRLTKRTRADATHAVGVLSSLGANIFGVVVNGIDGRSRGNYSYGNQYGYGYGGGYNYGYGEGRSGAYYADEDEPMRTIPQR